MRVEKFEYELSTAVLETVKVTVMSS